MSVRQSLLAILDQGSCYGYQLRAEIERRTGSRSSLNVGQIYNTLDRLERDELVAKADTDAEGHIYYAITDAGHHEVARWFATALDDAATARDELANKVALAVTLAGVGAVEIIRTQVTVGAARLQQLREKAAALDATSAESLPALLVLDAWIAHSQAELDWLAQTETRIADATSKGSDTSFPLNTDSPRRGRPPRNR